MIDFLLLILAIVLMISLYGLLAAVRSGSGSDKKSTYFTAENTAADQDGETA